MDKSAQKKTAGPGTAGGPPRERVLICGLGLRLGNMTFETLQALKRCRTVFHDFLDDKAARYVRTICPDLRDLRKLRRTYDSESMADAVLPAVAKGHTVAFLGYGHPMVLQGTAEVIITRCKAAKIPYRVIASLSALDELLVAVGTPVMMDGLQICPSHVLTTRQVPLYPGAPAIIMLLNHLWGFPGASVAGCVKHLGTIYPPEHRVLLIRCPRVVGDPLLRLETPLRKLAAALEKLPGKERFNTSMFIPALASPSCAPSR